MLVLGSTLRCNLPPRHVWIVLTDPTRTGGQILLANLTSLTDDSADDACILGPADYALLTHQTTVAYSRARIGTVSRLDDLIRSGEFTEIAPVPAATMQKILQGGRASRELSAASKRLIG